MPGSSIPFRPEVPFAPAKGLEGPAGPRRAASAMFPDLRITLAPERLEEGAPEERAAFGLLSVITAEASLTEGFDHHVRALRAGPLVSGYHAAEWLAWNWWRLRWEPRSRAPDWSFAHRMSAIGNGYDWPNLTIQSDGVRTVLLSRPSAQPDAKPFRYFGAHPVVRPSGDWDQAVDAFVPQALGRLRDAGIAGTNLDRIWSDVLADRADPALAELRRLEAMLGRDPDAVDDGVVEGLIADAEHLGRPAVGEIAANSAAAGGRVGAPLTAAEFHALARDRGHDAAPADAVALNVGRVLPRGAEVPARRLGAAVARALRDQQRLGHAPIGDAQLAAMAGTRVETLTDLASGGADLSFALDGRASRLVLRSRWHIGRRFDLARLLGDRILGEAGALLPATRAYTYRQKAQRAFAAELLSPFEAVDAMLAGDPDDEERKLVVAEHFDVSPLAIETQLIDQGRLRRGDPEQDCGVEAP